MTSYLSAFSWSLEFKSDLKCLHTPLFTKILDSESLETHLQMLEDRTEVKKTVNMIST